MVDNRALVLNGTVGVGKTTTAELIARRWQAAGVPGALIDVDALRRSWPAPAGDPFATTVGLANLAAVARVHRDHGARWLVVADVLEDADQRRRQAAALGVPTTVVRLAADPATVRPRLVARHGDDHDDGAALAWHQHRVAELAAILAAADADDAVVAVDGLDPEQVATAVLHAARWDETGTR